MKNQSVRVGTNARLFPSNWRPALDEVAFAHTHGFDAIQFHGQTEGLSATQLGAEPAEVGTALLAAGLAPVMEILMFVDGNGLHESGRSPLDIFTANLPAITALGCVHVHWHIALRQQSTYAQTQIDTLEAALVPQIQQALEVASAHGFRFAVEHNSPEARPFHTPDRAAALLDAVFGLGLVWDLNHAAPEQVVGYHALAPRISMLHVADTPLPEVNYHLPLGRGTIDFSQYLAGLLAAGFDGPAILEIGGLPKSGGYGRDTDAALIESRAILLAALETASHRGV